jgi:hypothetical protein
MAIPVYPAGLPLAQRDGYGFEPTNQIRRTPMDSGRARQRVEFSNVPTMVNLSWRLTQEQARLFQPWAIQVAGAGWIEMPLLSPMGFEQLEARFTESPRGPQLLGKFLWEFRAVCELRKIPMFENGWVEILPDYILYSDIFDYAMNREWPLNEWQVFIEAMDTAINQDWPQP